MRLEVARETAASADQVWAVLTDWERQPDWMLDAKAVEVLTPWRTGVGVAIRCPTNLMGLTVQDVMRVTVWQPPEVLEVVHLGRIIRGSGVFTLRPLTAPSGTESGAGRDAVPGEAPGAQPPAGGPGHGTRVTWTEQIVPPLGLLGRVGARALTPVLRSVFGRSLERLLALVDDS